MCNCATVQKSIMAQNISNMFKYVQICWNMLKYPKFWVPTVPITTATVWQRRLCASVRPPTPVPPRGCCAATGPTSHCQTSSKLRAYHGLPWPTKPDIRLWSSSVTSTKFNPFPWDRCDWTIRNHQTSIASISDPCELMTAEIHRPSWFH